MCNVALSVKFYTQCVILHSVKYLIPYVCGGDLRCFVAGQICRKFTHFSSVKCPGLKMCACKKDDKYQLCQDGNPEAFLALHTRAMQPVSPA